MIRWVAGASLFDGPPGAVLHLYQHSGARILRERLGYAGELRAVGDVLLEQARFMIRCGFDAFEPAVDTGPEQWTAAGYRYRHVYQRAADALEPAFVERAQLGAATPLRPPSPPRRPLSQLESDDQIRSKVA